MYELIQVTAQYSNSVLLVLLPFIGDFVKRTELGVPIPITIQQVQQFKCDPRKGHVGGSILLTNGVRFVFDDGHVALFETPKAYSFLQDPERIPEFYGPVNIDEATALAIARKALLSLDGTAIADLVNQRPKVISPPSVEGNLVPRYQFQWMMPGPGQWPWVQVEVDASNKAIQTMMLLATNFWLETPRVEIAATPVPRPATQLATGGTPLNPVTSAYSNALLLAVLPQVSEFARKLDLHILNPIEPSMVGHVEVGLLGGEPSMQIELTNEFRFLFRHGYVCLFRSPDCFFAPSYEMKGKTYDDFVAPIFMSEAEMIAMGKAAVRKLGYTEKILPLTNRVHAAGGPNRQTKPDLSRFYFQWDNSSEDNPYPPPVVGCEIDGSTKTLKSLYLNHKDLWHSPPAIDVPPN